MKHLIQFSVLILAGLAASSAQAFPPVPMPGDSKPPMVAAFPPVPMPGNPKPPMMSALANPRTSAFPPVPMPGNPKPPMAF